MPSGTSRISLDDLTFSDFGDSDWSVRRDGSSQGGSLIVAADKRMPDGYEVTATMVDSLADEMQACVETLDMLDFT